MLRDANYSSGSGFSYRTLVARFSFLFLVNQVETQMGHPHITSYSWRGTLNQYSELRTRPLADTDTSYYSHHASEGRMTSNLSSCLPTHGELSFCLPMHGVEYNHYLCLAKAEFSIHYVD